MFWRRQISSSRSSWVSVQHVAQTTSNDAKNSSDLLHRLAVSTQTSTIGFSCWALINELCARCQHNIKSLDGNQSPLHYTFSSVNSRYHCRCIAEYQTKAMMALHHNTGHTNYVHKQKFQRHQRFCWAETHRLETGCMRLALKPATNKIEIL